MFDSSSRSRLNAELFTVSFLMLFAEVILIRWISTESRIFAYVNNLVLLACFLGIGFGCYHAQRKILPSLTAFSLTALVLLIHLPIEVTIHGDKLHLFRDVPILLSAFTDSVVWYESGARSTYALTLIGMATTFVIFALVLVSFVPLGQLLGRALDKHRSAIGAYSLNITASILGVWGLAVLSFMYIRPHWWFILAGGLLLVVLFLHPRRTILSIVSIVVLIAAALFLAWQPSTRSESLTTLWSPYQKLDVEPLVDEATGVKQGYLVNVNNVGYMAMLNLSDQFVAAHSDNYSPAERSLSQYDIAYRINKNAADALILGAGAGNDVAGALRGGAETVDAVEIDPGIIRIGSRFHPERPYNDTAVNLVVDDARAFLARTENMYDVISFGLLDAHTLSSSYNNMRIDHYVYTLECLQQARERLRPDGILTIVFEAQRPWIRRRLHDMLQQTFGYAPVVFRYDHSRYGFGGTMFVIGRESGLVETAIRSDLGLDYFVKTQREDLAGLKAPNDQVPLTVDDWPYFYLEKPGIPNMHLCVMVIVLMLALVTKGAMLARGIKTDFHFFFLGAAFLLLEFQNISKSTLLFGATWLVNSFIITGILVFILLANLVVSYTRTVNLKLVYLMLLISLLLVYGIPLGSLTALSYWPRAVVGLTLLNLPVFFSGIVFITSFRTTPSRKVAFGSNLLGAAVGGVLESLSFILGINALVLLVILFYGLSLLALRKLRPGTAPAVG